MGAEEHGATLRACPSASAWPRRPPGSSTSANVRTALFNWLFARARGRRVPAPDREHRHGREVDEATEQIQDRSRWLGLDWDGEVDVPARPHGRDARRRRERLVAGGHRVRGRRRDPLPDARRGRRPAFDDVVLGRDRGAERRARGPRPRPLGRPPDLQLRLAARGLLGRDHARHPRRRPHLEHAEADPGAARGRRRAAGVRARAERQRRGRRASCRSATAPSRSTTSATPATCPRRS